MNKLLESSSKRRKISVDMYQEYFSKVDEWQRKVTVPQMNVQIPTPKMSLNVNMLHAYTPEQLFTAIMQDQRHSYTKQEVLYMMRRLFQMTKPQFPSECPYIG